MKGKVNMKSMVRKFDTYLGEKIGLLPKSWYGFLNWLCIPVSPVGWSVVLVVGIIVSLYLKEDSLLKLSIATFVVLPLAEVIKLIFRRPRPLSLYAASMRLKSYSFPSGHAYGAGLGFGYLLFVASLFITGAWLWLIAVVLALGGITVAGARVYLKAHFPSDVTVGLVLGVTVIFFIGRWAL